MKGISQQALGWSLGQLKAWAEGEEPGKRVKQVIYRLLLLRQLGVTKTTTTQLTTADFKRHCRRFLLVSGADLAEHTGGRENYFVPSTCEYQKASGAGQESTDWAIGTMWTRCETWRNSQIIEFEQAAGTQGTRAFKFSDNYVDLLRGQLGGKLLPALPLALFLFRDQSTSEVSVAQATTPQLLVDLFLKTFNLSDPEVKALFDLSTSGLPGPITHKAALTSAQVLHEVLAQFPFSAANQESDTGSAEAPLKASKYEIPKSEQKGPSALPVQLLIHGCPGSGKSYEIQQRAKQLSRAITVVFHPETSYADFVGVYRPFPVYRKQTDSSFVDEVGTPRSHGEPYVTYEFVAGPLLDAYCLAKANPGESVALIIEELSRANASLVFGDVLQLLDRLGSDKDGRSVGESVYEITPKPEIAAYLKRHGVDVVADGRMRFPSNLHIWATMNRSDQNARQLDSAFLRRWDKQYLSYAMTSTYGSVLVDVPNGQLSWDELRSRINNRLIGLAPEDKFVGPYFLREDRLSSRSAVAEDLLGYLWNDVLKARARDLFATETFAQARESWIEGKDNPFKDIALP